MGRWGGRRIVDRIGAVGVGGSGYDSHMVIRMVVAVVVVLAVVVVGVASGDEE